MRARIKELLVAAGEAMADGRDPFSTEWLCEHAVTFQECNVLSMSMAQACIAFAVGGEMVESIIQGVWGAHAAGIDPGVPLQHLFLREAAITAQKAAEKALQDPDSKKE